jgi:hypothetical protein
MKLMLELSSITITTSRGASLCESLGLDSRFQVTLGTGGASPRHSDSRTREGVTDAERFRSHGAQTATCQRHPAASSSNMCPCFFEHHQADFILGEVGCVRNADTLVPPPLYDDAARLVQLLSSKRERERERERESI